MDGLITVSCNKVATTCRNDDVLLDKEDVDDDDDYGDDDVEGDDDSGMEDGGNSSGDHIGGVGATNTGDNNPSIEITRPSYEEDIYSLFTNIRNLSKEGREKLELYAKQHTQDLEQTKKDGKKKVPVENNKKRILRAVMEPLHKMYNCHVPLQAIDMIGVVKNGKVLCVECGVMTEYKNFNMTSYGPICMRHRYSSIMRHHPVWSSGAPYTPPYTQGPSPTTAAILADLVTTKKRPLHNSLFLKDDDRCSCTVCHLTRANIVLVVRDQYHKLTPLKCCSVCYVNIRNRNVKQVLLSIADVTKFAELKGYPPFFI
jgi:hypothetical protein